MKSKNKKITILGQDYLVKTGSSNNMDQVVSYVNNKMSEAINSGMDVNSQQLKIAVLSAMNIADELFQSLDKNSNIISTIETKGNSFIEYIDDRIKEIESQSKD